MFRSARILSAIAALSVPLLAAAPACAQDEPAAPPSALSVTGSVSLVSDYRFRGVSQSRGDPAVQGTINLNHSSGAYVGVWSSSVDFGPAGDPTHGNVEVDLYGGWSGEVASGLKADAGLLYYAYPGGHLGKANVFEPYASIAGQLGPANLKLGASYAWKQASLGHDDNIYVYGNADVSIPRTPLTVSGHLGYTHGALAPDWQAGGSSKHGFDWSLGATATVLGKVTLGLSYIGSQGRNVKDLTDDAVVGTVTYSF